MRDLSDQLTVFLITAGTNPSYPLCLEAIRRQSVSFRLEVIRDYHPLSAAFQEMLTRCRTPYYIQVDEDMILHEGTVEKMYAQMCAAAPEVALLCFLLRDVHLDKPIYGVKIYKHEIFKAYPYNLVHNSCEVEQLERMQRDGYRHDFVAEVVGDHAPCWSKSLIFERYLNLMEKFKDFGYSWLEEVPGKLWNLLRENPSEENLYALLGAFSSIFSDKRLLVGEKDFTDRRKECDLVRSYLERPLSLNLYMTGKCNFECRYCYRQHQALESAPDLTAETVADALWRFPTIRSACVCGMGEPLMATTLVPVFRVLKQSGIFTGLITNGSLLAERLGELEDCRPDQISVSLYGSVDDVHAGYTKTAEMYEAALAGIRASVKSGIPTYMSYICTKETWHDLRAFLRLAASLEVQGVHLLNLLPHFSDEPDDPRFWDLVLTEDDRSWIEDLRRLPESSIVKKYPVLIRRGESSRRCDSPWNTLGINGNGSITICNSVYPPRKENGTLLDNVIWHNAYCTSFRESRSGNQYPACKQCFRNWDQ